MFGRRNKEIDPAIEAEYKSILAEVECKDKLVEIMRSNNLKWNDVLGIVRESLK